MDQTRALYAVLLEKITRAHEQPIPFIERVDVISLHCQETLMALKALPGKRSFRLVKDEIHFFKTVKPPFTAELFYYNHVYSLHAHWPMGGKKVQQKYLRHALEQVTQFYEKHSEFFTYYREGCTDRDKYYFTRGPRSASLLPPDGYCFATDDFTTGYDMVIGQLLAYERFQEYLLNQLESLKKKGPGGRRRSGLQLPWTGSKMAAIELVYGLAGAGVINNGRATLREIAEGFKELFQIDLGNYSDGLADIRARKKNTTVFMDELKAALLKKLDEESEKTSKKSFPTR